MKFENKRYILSVFLTILMVFGTLMSGYADENSAPVFSEDESTTRSVAENTAADKNIGTAFTATDADNDTLTYTLSGTDAASFSIVSTSGQLQTSTALDFETKSSYSVTVSVSDGNGGSDAIDVTIDVTNVNEPPRFPTIRARFAIAENAAPGTNIGGRLTAADPDIGDTLTYSLQRGDREVFQINPNTGQMQTKAPLDYETKRSYTDLAVRATDSSGAIDAVLVTINVTDVDEIDENRAPSFAEGTSTTRAVAENTGSGQDIGSAISATDPDNDTLAYTIDGVDAASFSINGTTGQLQTKAALDYETKTSYAVTVFVFDGNGASDSIDVTINITEDNGNRAPTFTDGNSATRAVAENTASRQNIGSAVSATDPDNDKLTYTLGGTDAAAFRINTNNGQLKTRRALDYETKSSYTVTITVSDSELTDTIDVTINVTDVDENRAPSFTEGTSTTRAVAENTGAGQDIGSAISATDPDDDTLTYTLGGTDAAAFSIDNTNGQLQTKAALDYETKAAYTVTIIVSDTKLTDSIDVTINITDVNENRAPVFTEGSDTTRSIAENTSAGQNIGTMVSATDPNTGDTLTYTLGGADAASFSINGTNGQLQTKATLNYETKTSYTVTITVSDTKLTDSIDVTIEVTDIYEPIIHRTKQVQDAIIAAVPGVDHADDVTVAHLAAITTLNPAFRGITSLKSGDFKGLTALTYLNLSGNPIGDISVLEDLTTLTSLYLASTSISDISALENLTALKNLYLTHNSITDISVLGNLTALTELSLGENSVRDISVLQNLTALKTLILDNNSISDVSVLENLTTLKSLYLNKNPISDYGPLRRLIAAIAGIENHPGLTLDIVIPANNAPVFTDGSSTTRAVAENTASGQNIGAAVAATDADSGDTLTYSLGGTDAASFNIDDTNGQLQTSAALDYETKTSYSVIVSVSDDNGGSDSITVTINITDVNENRAPVFTDGSSTTRAVAENTGSGQNIGTRVSATDANTGDTLTYTLGGADAASFSINGTNGQLQTSAALDYETQTSYTVTITVSDTKLTDSINVTISVTNVNEAPNFTEGSSATRAIAENTASDTDIGSAVAATDPDDDTLTYTLGGADAASFGINGTNGQLQTKAALDYEAKSSYSVTITVSDSELTDTIDVTINVANVDENRAPAFAEGTSTTRAVAENTGSGQDIGTMVSATDADNDTLTYSLSGADADSFSIVNTSGQLQTKAALDYETKVSYTVIVSVSDGNGGSDSITVTITVTDVNENRAPVFTDGSSTTRAVAENTGSGQDIGSAVSATDPDSDALTYTLGGTDAASFSIDDTNGQLQTSAALDYETKAAYTVRITVSDGELTDSIDVTINITDVNENRAPVFTDGSATTRSIAENTASGQDIGTMVSATDANTGDTLTYTLGGADAASFSIDGTNGQLQTKAALDYETQTAYTVTITVSDTKLTDTIDVTITVTNVNEAPSFTEGSSATRTIAENTASGTNIDTTVAATDVDANTTLTYTLGGADAASFTIDGTNGQLRTNAALNYETKTSYSVTITVSDSEGGTDTIEVMIDVTDVYEPIIHRTKQVQDAIIAAVPGVDHADDVTVAHLAAITRLDLDDKSITALKSGDFDELPALKFLDLDGNSISDISSLAELTALTDLYLSGNAISDISPLEDLTALITLDLSENNSISDISALEDLTALEFLYLWRNSISDISALADLTALTMLDLSWNSIRDISSLEDLTALKVLYLNGNSISNISALGDLTALITLDLSKNTSISDISTLEGLTALTELYLWGTSISDISSLGGLTALKLLNLQDTSISNISTLADLTTLTELNLSENSISNISSLEGLTALTELYLFDNPISNYGPLRRLIAAIAGIENHPGLTLDIVVPANNAPVFTDGSSTTRAVAENTASGQNIGAAVAATDADSGDPLTYSLGGADATSFSIVSTSGQLQTKAALDYETKTSYAVTVSVSDDNGGSDSIAVTINVTDADENRAPAFAEGTSTTRSVAENTGSGQDIGTMVSATDADTDDTLTYTLGGADAASFSINGTNGQLQTKAALDYETQTSYTVTLTVSDTKLTDSIDVTINVTDVNEAPSFANSTATRSIAENTASGEDIGAAVVATDPDADDTLTYTLGGTDVDSFSIVNTSGQLRTHVALDHETKASYSVTVTATDGDDLSDTTTVTITVTDVNEAPNFATTTATRSVAENTAANINIGDPLTATDPDTGDTLTYTLGGTDAASFSINGTNGQLKTKAALDYEAKSSYSVTITVSDSELTDTIAVTINVTDADENRAPAFAEGTSTTRSVAENTGSGQDIGTMVSATDADNDTLTYSLSGADADSFSIVNTSGQLQTKAALDYETKVSYTVIVSVSDGNGGSDSITVTITVTDVNENRAPVFTDGSSTTRSVAENTGSGQDIGSAVSATDLNADTLTYTLGGADAASFSINGTNGQLQTKAALDYEAKTSYSVSITVSDTKLTDTIDVTINVTDVNEAPNFASSTATRSIAENTASGEDIGAAVVATDPDTDDTLTYTLGGTDVDSFSIVNTSGQLRTNVALDHETKASYSVTVTATDGDNLSDTTTVTISVTDVNEAPNFTEGSSATRAVAENTASDTDIGSAVAATDPDDDTLTYTLSGADAASFSIDGTNGQLQTSGALDYETQTSYTVTITVSDGELTDTIDVTINVTDVGENRAPVFTDGSATTRSIAENTDAGQDIGSAIAATDPNTDTLTYTLGGADAASFSINGTNGQLQTKAALDYETQTSYTVTITVSDTKLTDSIDVTITVTNVNEAPSFATDTATRSIAENTASGEDIGAAVVATDPDSDDTLTYTLGGTDVDSFSIVNTSGQLRTSVALDHETKASYSVTVTATDGDNLSDTTTVTISVTNVNEAPSFTEGSTATRAIAENTASDTDIGAAFTATDVDANTTLTYTLGGADAASFSINGTNGQLKTSAALDYEAKSSYSVSITVSDSELTDTIDVTINVTDVNENRAPVFTDGSTTTRAVAENTDAGQDIGSAVSATDLNADTLTYTLGGADAASFSIDGTNGQLQTKAALDYETQTSYTVTITVSDTKLTDSIDVTINVTDVNEAPNFASSTATRSIAENTASGEDIGAAVVATDPDADDTLTYTLGGTDVDSFSIVNTSGQLRTNVALDHETKASYSVTVTATDGDNLSDTSTVTINVTDVNEAPSFTEGSTATRSIAENTGSGENIGAAIAAIDVDANTTLTYTLGGTDADSFSIVGTSGQLQTRAALDYETKTSYSVIVAVSDGNGGSDTIAVTINVTDVDETPANRAPIFTDGASTARSIAENSNSGMDIGTAIAASDADDDTLTYTLGGADAAMFSIDDTTGQLRTREALDYETKTSYSVTITVSDTKLTNTIDVTINVMDVDENRAPVFTDGSTTTRAVAENTDAGQDIGSAIAATDVDTDDTLTYTLGGADAASFGINGTNGQLQTKAALDYETKASYTVTLTVSDTKLTDTIDVTINVTNVNEAPSFAINTATRSVAENTAADTNIGAAFTATDVDADTTLTYTLGGTDVDSFSIVGTNGQLQTSAALDHETKASYSVTVTATDGGNLSDTTTVTISVTDVNEAPIFATNTATRSIAENTASGENIGAAVVATDPDTDDTVTYTLGGTDVDSFSIVGTNGQLQTSAALDHETKASYSVTVTATDDGNLSNTTTVTISVTNVNEAPSFTDGSTATRSISENKPAGTNLGAAFTATDVDANTTLTYTLGGTDAATFRIVSTNGRLRTGAVLNYETKTAYAVTITVSDNEGGTDTIDITIDVTDVYEPIIHRTQEVQDAIVEQVPGVNHPDYVTVAHLAAITTLDLFNKGITSLKSGDFNELPALTRLHMGNNSISDISALADLTALTLLDLYGNSVSNISTLAGLTTLEHLNLADNSINNISALAGLTALEYLYLGGNSISDISALSGLTALIDLSLAENSISDISALSGLTALTSLNLFDNSISDISTLSGLTALTNLNLEANSISNISALAGLTALTNLYLVDNSISNMSVLAGLTALTTLELSGNPISDYDPLRKLLAAIAAIEDHPGLTIDINIPPVFTDGTSTTRAVAEDTATYQDIGDPVSATDVDNDYLIYSLAGLNADTFFIDSGTGQLQTFAALDYETKSSYSVTVSVEDSKGGTDSIAVTINVTDVNYAPAFTEGDTTARSVAENTRSGQDIGTAVAATDKENETLTYSLGGTDEASFSIDTATGQLRTRASLNYRTKNAYSVTVSVSDGKGGTDSITVTINVTNVPVSQRTQAVQDAIIAAVPDVWDADEVTSEHLAAITRLDISNYDITSLKSGDFNGLTGLTWLDLSFNSISDISELSGLTTLTYLNLSDNSISNVSALRRLTALKDLKLWGNSITDISALSGLTALTILDLDSNSVSNIWVLRGLTALKNLSLKDNSISNVSALEGLTALTGLDLEGNPISNYDPLRKLLAAIAVIEDHPGLTLDINIPPAFTDGTSTTRAVAEYTPSGKDIGDPVSATDVDSEYLSYSLEGADADSFSIVESTGQLQTSAALNYRTKRSYSVTVSVSDDYSNTDSITVTINVTDVNEAGITPVDQRTQAVQDAIMGEVPVWNADEVTPAHLAAIETLDISQDGIQSLKSGDFSGLPALTSLRLDGNTISNISPLSGLTALEELNLRNTFISDISALRGLTKLEKLDLSQNTISNIWPLSGLTALTELNLVDNSISNVSPLEGLTALTDLKLSDNPISNYDPLRRLAAAIAEIEGHTDLLTLDINIPPVFTEGTHTRRYVAEYTLSNRDIGDPVSATDANIPTSLTYTLGGRMPTRSVLILPLGNSKPLQH